MLEFIYACIISITITISVIVMMVVFLLGGGEFLAILAGLLVIPAGMWLQKVLENKVYADRKKRRDTLFSKIAAKNARLSKAANAANQKNLK